MSLLEREREVVSYLNRLADEARHPAEVYFAPVPALSSGLPVPLFGAMLLVWQLRSQDLQRLYPLDTVASRLAFLSWCVCSGLREYALLRECAPFAQALDRPAFAGRALPEGDAGHALTWRMVLAALQCPGLGADLRTPEGRAVLLAWHLEHGAGLLPTGAGDGECAPVTFSDGINVIGHVSGVSGIAEDARMALAALGCTHLAVQAIDHGAGAAAGSRRHPHAVNLFCFPALEQARYVAEQGLGAILGRYNIGYWPWEIAHWPEQWRHLFALVDEVWTSSDYTRAALAAAAPVPVLRMPMAVEAPPVSGLARRDFALPEDAFLFYFSFDFRSSGARKNPQACVAAFCQAFPGTAAVGLVIKVLHPEHDDDAWQSLQALARRDRRIHLVERTLSRPDLMALYAACDCLVSLHRAEGFGRNIAEAMMLGKPVIATAYSGNLDFTTADNSCLVSCSMTPLRDGDYPGVAEGAWAEPDIGAAACAMRRIAHSPTLAARLASAGTLAMHAHAAPRVAQAWLARLNSIHSRFHNNENIHELV